MMAGEGGMRGNTVGVVGFDALSALYTPNVLQGSWGAPRRPAGASLPGSAPGNAYDGFQARNAQGQAGAAGVVPQSTPASSAYPSSDPYAHHWGIEYDGGGHSDLTDRQAHDQIIPQLMRGGGLGNWREVNGRSVNDPTGIQPVLGGVGKRTREESEALYGDWLTRHEGMHPYQPGTATAGPPSSTTTLMAAIQGLAHGLNTQQLAVLLQQVVQSLGRIEANGRPRMPAQNGPGRTSAGAIHQANAQGFNSNRPGR